MMHEIFALLQASLKDKSVPVPFTYGPGRVPDKVGATRIEMSRSYDQDDRLGPGKTDRRNPPMVAVRAMAAKIRVFARDTKEGAMRHDHERLAERIADHIHASLIPICREAKTQWRVLRAGFVNDETSDGWSGVIFELKIEVDRGVYAFPTWQESALPEINASGSATNELTATPAAATHPLPSATTRVS